jgi:hypothetical protein
MVVVPSFIMYDIELIKLDNIHCCVVGHPIDTDRNSVIQLCVPRPVKSVECCTVLSNVYIVIFLRDCDCRLVGCSLHRVSYLRWEYAATVG